MICRTNRIGTTFVSKLEAERGFRSTSTLHAMGSRQPIENSADSRRDRIAEMMPGFLHWINLCNNGLAPLKEGTFTPFVVSEETSPIGYLSGSFLQHILRFPDVFVMRNREGDVISQGKKPCVTLAPHLQTADMKTRSRAVGEVMASLRDQGVIIGWRNEEYPVLNSFYDDPCLLLERAAAPFFGIKAYGVHINGYVVLPDGHKELWVARRAANKPTWPGRLDHIVAGGQPYGISLAENVLKECHEEASIPAALAKEAMPVGAVSYTSLQQSGLKRDVLFCYDIELPPEFVPVPQDGEVEEFFRLPLDEVAAAVADHKRDPYKDNCNLVILDFLIRHGVITPDIPGYLDIVSRLRSGDCT